MRVKRGTGDAVCDVRMGWTVTCVGLSVPVTQGGSLVCRTSHRVGGVSWLSGTERSIAKMECDVKKVSRALVILSATLLGAVTTTQMLLQNRGA